MDMPINKMMQAKEAVAMLRAQIRIWQGDLESGLKPTEGSLVRAMDRAIAIEEALYTEGKTEVQQRIYAVQYEDGKIYCNMTLEEAVKVFLEDGGYRWEIRYHDGLYSLWTTRASVFADTHGFAEEQHYWGLSRDAVLNKLIGTSRGKATLLPMSMLPHIKEQTNG